MAKLILEITSPSGDKKYIQPDSFPVNLGRGFSNDIIIDDDYVSKEHLQIAFSEDEITITNLSLENGTQLLNKKNNITSETQIKPGDRIFIGKTKLKLLTPEYKIAETKILDKGKSFFDRYKFILMAWSSLILFVVLSTLNNFFASYYEAEFVEHFGDIHISIVGFILWAGFWTFIGKLSKKESAFHKQLMLVSIFFLMDLLLAYIQDFFVFNFPAAPVQSFFLNWLLPVYSIFIFYNVLKIGTKISTKKLKITVPTIVLLLFAVTHFTGYVQSLDYSSSISFVGSVKHPAFKLVKSKSIENYSTGCDALFDKPDIEDK